MNLTKIIATVVPFTMILGVGGFVAFPIVRDAMLHKASAPAPATLNQDADSQKGEAMDNYVYCINHVNDRIRDARKRYHSWVDPEKGPTGKERNVYGLYDVEPSILKACKDKLRNNKQLAGYDSLTKLAGPYEQELDKLTPKLTAANTYYEDEVYKEDGFAKGKQLHKDLEASFKSFFAAAKAFEDEEDRIGDERAAQNLVEIEKEEGKGLHYWHRKTIMDAKKVIVLIGAEEEDLVKEEAALDELDKSVKALNDAEAKQRKQPFMWAMFEDKPDEFAKQARSHWKRLKAKTKYTRREAAMIDQGVGARVEGSRDAVFETYNKMIDGSNAVNYNM
ncbi:MAG: DUF3829 domain-containing protein [Polyangiaceae bacterium]